MAAKMISNEVGGAGSCFCSPVENSCQAPQKARFVISQTKCGKNKVRKRGTITLAKLLF